MTTDKTKFLCPRCKKHKMVRNGVSSSTGKPQWVCRPLVDGVRTYCYGTLDPTAPYRDQITRPKRQADAQPRKKFRRKIDHRTVIITAAQNSTPTHMGFFRGSLTALAKDIDAEIAVIPLRYKNPTSVFSNSQRNREQWLRDVAEAELAEAGITEANYRERAEDTGWDPDIRWPQLLDQHARRYLYEQRKKFNDNVVVVGDVKVQPTMQDPLQGLEGLTHGESGIFGHTKLRLKCTATPQGRMPKILTTTGACTIPNYTDSKAGKKGEFHHVLGAVVLEIESRKKFHIHHINATRNGTFIFRRKMYHPDGSVTDAPRDLAIIFGDAHYRFADPQVVEATFGPGGLVEEHDPEILVWHDLLDCYFGNPHHGANPFIRKAKHDAGYHVAAAEVRETTLWMCKLGAGRKNYIVPSNHDNMFARWIINEDWKNLDPENMEFYLETALQMARSAKMSDIGAEYLDPFCYWVKRFADGNPDVYPLKVNEPLLIADIECGYHGDKGPGGARGTVKNLSTIGVKVISGHGHSPAIQDGHTRAGTMTRLTAEYVTGPNDWLNAHVRIDALGKRHLNFCIDGKFYMER